MTVFYIDMAGGILDAVTVKAQLNITLRDEMIACIIQDNITVNIVASLVPVVTYIGVKEGFLRQFFCKRFIAA